MILNVSSRTDIVAFYTEWFMNRYREGFVDVRNPFNPKLVSRINFDNVDLILFCTKDPRPIVKYLSEIDKPIIFQITLTSYKNDIETNVPNKKLIVDSIKDISRIIGIDNIYVRYDPIFISDKYNINYHKKAFFKMCSLLEGYVKHIIVSFMDDYKNVINNRYILRDKAITSDDYKEIGLSFSKSAKRYGMTVQTCFEDNNLVEYGFIKADCLSHELAYSITEKSYKNWTARMGGKCNCVQMVDIGVYNSCKHFCKYCYANYNSNMVNNNYLKHDDNSSLLIGYLEPFDVIKERYK